MANASNAAAHAPTCDFRGDSYGEKMMANREQHRHPARVLCHCCTKNYCGAHLNEHNDTFVAQLHQLADDINQLAERLRGESRHQLDQWQHDAHRTIDLFYEQKCRELDDEDSRNEALCKHREIIEYIKIKIAELIREQNVTQQQVDSLSAALRAVQREIDQIRSSQTQLKIRPFTLDDDSIRSEKANFDLASFRSAFLTKKLPTENCVVMASNARHLLFCQESNLCLFDRHLSMVKQVLWTGGSIWDMCWSSTLARFILVAEDGVFTLDDANMDIKRWKTIPQNIPWYCCACSDTTLFLASRKRGTMVNEYSLTLSSQKQPSNSRQVCSSMDEYVEHMKCAKESLALIILNEMTGARRLEMRSTTTFDQLWSISLNISQKINIVSCCTLDEKGWLVVDLSSARLIHVTTDGQIKRRKSYKPSPQYAVQFGSDVIAILTEQGVNLHKL